MKKLFCLLILFTVQSFSQNPNWMNYTSAERSYSLLNDGAYLWICSLNGGLIKLNKSTGALTYYNHANANLPGNQVMRTAKDSSGNLWIGSQYNGIGKFNGSTCRVFNISNSQLPSDQWNTAMETDREGNVWIGTLRYIVKINANSTESPVLKIFPTGNSFDAFTSISDIKFDESGSAWIGASWGLGRIKNDSLTQQFDGFNKNINALEISGGRTVWIATSYSGLFEYDGTNWYQFSTTNSGIPTNLVYDLKFDKDGILWLATGKGLAKFDGTAWNVFNKNNSGLHSDEVLSLEIDEEGIIWLGFFDDVIAKFDKNAGHVLESFNISNTGIINNIVNSVAEDSFSNKWISTINALTKFNGREWNTYDTTNYDQLDLSFSRIYEDSSKIMWKGSGLVILFRNKSDWIASDIENKHTGGLIKEDYNGTIWCVSNNGLWKFNGSEWTVYNTSNSSLPENNIKSIAVDMQNNLLVSVLPKPGNKGALLKYNGNIWETIYTCEAVNYWIPGIEIDKSGNIWIGISNTATVGKEFGRGIKKNNGSGWIDFNIYNSSLPSNSVMQICFDKKDNLWITTYGGGAAQFDGANKWNIFNKNNSGLPWDDVNLVYCDKENNKWFGIQMTGLAIYNEEGIILTGIKKETPGNLPEGFVLNQNYPNPFNPATNISFFLPHASFVSIKIYNVLGEEVETLLNDFKTAGNYNINYNPGRLAGGVYLYRMQTNGFSITKKFVLLK